MTAETPEPLDDREQRTLDALACGLAHHDPDFASRMAGGRAARPRRGAGGGAARGVLRVAALVLLAVVVSLAALVLGPGAVVLLVLAVAAGAIAVAAVRQHRRTSS